MPELRNVSGLEVGQDLGFEQRMWTVERVTWIAIALGLCAVALGLFGGSGPLTADSRTAAGGALTVDYDRFTRFGSPTSLEIALRGGEDARNVAVGRTWLDDYRIDGIVPEPESVTALPDRYVYTFDVGAAGRARFALTPREIGRHRGTVWGPSGAVVEFTQVVYP